VSQFIFDVPTDVEPESVAVSDQPSIDRVQDVGAVDLTHSDPRGPRPEEILALQYEYTNMTAWEQAYALFAQKSKDEVSEQEYAAYFPKAAPNSSVIEYSFPSVVVHGDHATIERVFTGATPKERSQSKATQEAVREEADWRILMRSDQVKAYKSVGQYASANSSSRSASASASTP